MCKHTITWKLLIADAFCGLNFFCSYWERVLLQNKPDVGPFTFSASLYDNGEIIFGYYFLPIDIANIEDGEFDISVYFRYKLIYIVSIFFSRQTSG